VSNTAKKETIGHRIAKTTEMMSSKENDIKECEKYKINVIKPNCCTLKIIIKIRNYKI